MSYDHRRRIAQEYDEPYLEVLSIFASQRQSMNNTANTLGVSRKMVRDDARRHNIHFVAQGEQREGCKQNGGKGKKRESGNRLGRRSPVLYNGIIYQPYDSTNCMVYEKYSEYERREFITAASELIVDNVDQ